MVQRADRRISHASANLAEWIGQTPDAVAGRDLADAVGADRADEITRLAADGRLEGNPYPVGTLSTDTPAGAVGLTAHTTGEHLVVTIEPAEGAPRATDLAALKHTVERLRGPFGVLALSERLADEVRGLTGFDRVMVYRFHPDHSGEVVAEAARAGLPSYLGLNYPAADIPAPAREIYKKVWVRVITDAGRPAVPLVSAPDAVGPVDLTHCPLRAVSPIHIEYLTNMGVTATMSLSLLRGTELWGLVACHHYSPRRLPEGVRTACEVVAQVASHNLAAAEDREGEQYRASARSAHDALVARAAGPGATLATLAGGDPGLLDLLPAGGAAVRADGLWAIQGDMPTGADLEAFTRWLVESRPGDRVFATDDLRAAYPASVGWANGACGLLAVRFSAAPRDLIVWCRPEDARTVRWAGDPTDKPVSYGPHGARLHPRRSFEEWRDSVRGRSAPWAAAEVDEAARLAAAIRELVLAQTERLVLANNLFRAAVEATTDAVVVTDADGRNLFCNPAASRIAGLPVAEHFDQGGPVAGHMGEQDQRVLAAGVGEEYEEQRTVGGSTRTYHVVKAPFCDGRGGVAGVVSISRDVTTRKQVEGALRAERDRFERIIATAPAVILSFRLRPDGTSCFPYASPRVRELYGITPEDIREDATPVFAMVHPDDVGPVRAAVADSARTMTPWRAEFRVIHPTRGEVWVEGHSAPVRDPDGGVVWHGSVADVTDRRRTERALRESEGRLRLAVEVAGLGVLEIDYRLHTATPSFLAAKLFGLPEGGTVSRAEVHDRFHPDDRADLDRQIAAALDPAGRGWFAMEHRVVLPDGAARWLSVRKQVYFDGTRPARAILVAADVTDQRAANAARARLAAIVESSADAIASKTLEGVIQTWNGGAERLFGYTAAEIVGKPVTVLIPAELHAEEAHILDRVRGGGQVDSPDTVRVTKEGRRVAVSLTVSPIRGDGGRIVGASAIVRDISDRKRAEASLRELNQTLERRVAERSADIDAQRRLLDAVLDALPIALIIAAPDGRLTRMNRACEAVWGAAPMSDDIEAYREWVGYWPDTGRRIEPHEWAMSRALTRGEASPGELVEFERFGDRARRFIMNCAAPVVGANGEVVAGVVASLDVTDRITAERALRQSEERYRAVVEDGTEVICRFKPDGTILLVNESYCRTFGKTQGELVGSSWAPAAHPDDVPAIKAELARMTSTNPVVRIENRVIDAAGRVRWMEFVNRGFYGPGGELLEIQAVGRDVTDRKEAERELARTRAVLQNLVDHAPALVFMKDAGGRYLLFNRKCEDVVGVRAETVLGRTVIEAFPPDLARQFDENDRRLVAAGVPQTVEESIPTADGKMVVSSVQFPVLGADGRLVAYGGVSVDITARTQAEEKLRNALDDLRRSNADLEQFAYVASHDLQEPLRAVAGCVQILRKRYAGQLDPAADELIGHAVDGAKRMQALIHDLLDYSRVATRKTEFGRVDSGAALRHALAGLAATVAEAGATVTADPLPAVEGNEAQLAQLFQNLVGNAIKYRGAAPPAVHVSARRAGDGWEFSVRDNGIGIAPEYFDRVFVIFQRLHTRSEYPGTGIGLAVCKKIVERHGGRIWVESQPGAGATFFFSIPDRRPGS